MRDRQTDRQRQGAGRTAARGPTPAVPAGASREPARTESSHAAMSCRPPPPADAPRRTERKARAEGRFRRPSAPCLPCEESPGTKAENLKPTDAAFGTPGGSRARGQDARSRRGPGAGSRGPHCATQHQRPLVRRQLAVPTKHGALSNADVDRILTSPGIIIFPFLEKGNRREQSQQDPQLPQVQVTIRARGSQPRWRAAR